MRKRSGTSSRSQTGSNRATARWIWAAGTASRCAGGELVTQLGHALLELVVALVELGQPLGGHVVAAGRVVCVVPSWPRSRRRISVQM
jgi:hypothetical protein